MRRVVLDVNESPQPKVHTEHRLRLRARRGVNIRAGREAASEAVSSEPANFGFARGIEDTTLRDPWNEEQNPVKIRSRWLTKAVTWAVVGVFRALFATCRKVYLTPQPGPRLDPAPDDPDTERYIALVWHDTLLFPTFGSTRTLQLRTSCLTSRHHDGSYVAELMNWVGITSVRGSTNHGGAAAIRQMMIGCAGRHIVITPDGPRGPRRRMKPGAVFLASQTGRRICVTAFSCRSGWRFQGAWTDLLVPKPFTTIYMLAAPPLSVPPDLSRDELDRFTRQVQTTLDDLYEEADRRAKGQQREVHREQRRAA